MGNILLDNQKTDIRFQNEDIVLYEPSSEQYTEIVRILNENVEMETDGAMQGEVGLKHIRYIFRELVKDGNFIDEYSDGEFEQLINKGNRKLKTLFREITDLLQEILEDIQWNREQQMKTMNSFINIANSKDSADKIKLKAEKLLKKNGLDITLEELTDIKNNPEMVEKLMNKLQTKKIIKPQDRKKKTK